MAHYCVNCDEEIERVVAPEDVSVDDPAQGWEHVGRTRQCWLFATPRAEGV